MPRKTGDQILSLVSEAGVVEVLAEKEGRRPAMYFFPRVIAISEASISNTLIMRESD